MTQPANCRIIASRQLSIISSEPETDSEVHLQIITVSSADQGYK
jgi:hypothetical protein